jgi:hypothetical protein
MFFSACKTHRCEAFGHMINEVFNDPILRVDKAAGGGISLVNEFLFNNDKLLEESDELIQDIWNDNIIPKLQNLLNTVTTRHH